MNGAGDDEVRIREEALSSGQSKLGTDPELLHSKGRFLSMVAGAGSFREEFCRMHLWKSDSRVSLRGKSLLELFLKYFMNE